MAIAPSTTNFNALVQHLRCNITMDWAYEPVHTVCNHLFDWPAICNWLLVHRTCPVCRTYNLVTDLRPVRIVVDMLNTLGLSRTNQIEVANTATASTQTDDVVEELIGAFDRMSLDQVPELITPIINGPTAPFIATSNIHLSMADLPAESMLALGRGKLLEIDSNVPTLTNPQGSHINDIRETLQRQNLSVLASLGYDSSIPFHYLPLHKYVYQSADTDACSVAFSLSRNGYFVYDLFPTTTRNGLVRYILYSINLKAHFSNNNLSSLRN